MGRADLLEFWMGSEGPFLYDPTVTRIDGTTESPLTFVPSGGVNTTRAEDFLTEVADGADGTAIHDNVTGEIAAVTEKTVPVGDDLYLIEDSEDGFSKKRVKRRNAEEHFLSVRIPSPSTNEDVSIGFANLPITITNIRAVLIGSGGPSLTWTLRHDPDRSAAGSEVVTGGSTTTSTTTGDEVTSFNDATIPVDSFIWFETTARSGSVSEVFVIVTFTYD